MKGAKGVLGQKYIGVCYTRGARPRRCAGGGEVGGVGGAGRGG